MREKIASIVLLYALMLVGCLIAYHFCPNYQKQLEFWIPQLFLVVLIVVTTIYVLLTANLVEETKRLQQRPLIQLVFREVSTEPTLRMDDLFEPAQQSLRGLVAKIVGGEQLQVEPRFLILEFKNIGHTTVRNLKAKVVLSLPVQSYTQECEVGQEIETGKALQIAIAPAPTPLVSVRVVSVNYGDGFRTFSNFGGNPIFLGTMGQASLS